MLKKVLAKKIDQSTVEGIVSRELAILKNTCQFRQIFLFGSAARGEMTDYSDLDFLVVCDSEKDIKLSKKQYYLEHRGDVWPVDVVFVSVDDYARRSKIGGVCMVCRKEGILLAEVKQ